MYNQTKRILITALLTGVMCLNGMIAQLAQMERDFRVPGKEQQPYVWWHWMGTNFSEAGITKDLEYMAQAGIGGATIFNIASAVQETHDPTLNNPWPENTYRSASYWDAMLHAGDEALRLGLELGIHNSVGYSTMGGPWIDQEHGMQRIVLKDTVYKGGDIDFVMPKPYMPPYKGWGAFRTVLPEPSRYIDLALFAFPESDKTDIDQIRDLSHCIDLQTGRVICKLPEGDWRIVRYGFAPTMTTPHPVPDELIGKAFEVDKLSCSNLDYHWENVLKPLCDVMSKHVGGNFKHILVDSYEAQLQSWSDDFREVFIQRKGYDPMKWILTGSNIIQAQYKASPRMVIVNSEDESRRFEWDYQDVIAQLFLERSWKLSRENIHKYGMTFWHEPYTGPFNHLDATINADVPMGEFWTSHDGTINQDVVASARAGGKRIVCAEAFTGGPGDSKWTEDPAFLKHSADGSFLSGANRLVLHHMVHQPFEEKYQPGMGMGWWGTHFGRHQTWAEPGKEFFKYLARCQAMLQQGAGVGDYLCVDFFEPGADAISSAYLLSNDVSVSDNQIQLPSGRRYPFLIIGGKGRMLPELAGKVKELLLCGAVIVCPRPTTSPSLKDYPDADSCLQRIAQQVWDKRSGNKWMGGYLFDNKEDALAFCGIETDLHLKGVVEASDNKSGNTIQYTHRYTDDTHIYFIANRIKEHQTFSASFRVTGYDAELWNPEDGSIKSIPKSEDGVRTILSLETTPQQAYFVVFTKRPENKKVKDKVRFNLVSTGLSVKYPDEWAVEFKPKLGTPFNRRFARLHDFSKHSDREILYFAGTATYRKEIEWKKKNAGMRYLLDLGEVNDIVSVSINASSERVLWYPPFKMDITDLLCEGKNILQIKVTNNWANALIGDEQIPADFEYGNDRGERGRPIKGYPDWFLKGEPRPSGRKTFAVWQYFRADSELYPAGLVGPVEIAEYQ